MEQDERKSSAGKIAMMSCLIAIGALFSVGVMAVLGSVLFLDSGSSSSSFPYAIDETADESPFDDFEPAEPEAGEIPDFFDSLNEGDQER